MARALPAAAAVTTASVQGRNHLMPGSQWQRHRPSSPEDPPPLGELGRDWLAHQEHQPQRFPQPLGVLLKQDLTSGVKTNPAFSSEKNFSCLPLSLFFSFFPLSPPPARAWPASPALTVLKGKLQGYDFTPGLGLGPQVLTEGSWATLGIVLEVGEGSPGRVQGGSGDTVTQVGGGGP